MIKAIVLDVDGVVVGPRSDQYPHPTRRLTSILQNIQQRGISVSLLSGKTSFIIGETIKHIGLTGFHVADSGAVVFDAIRDVCVFENTIKSSVLQSVIQAFAHTDINLHAFSRHSYVQLRPFEPAFNARYINLIGRPPADMSLDSFIDSQATLKLNIYAFNPTQKHQIDEILAQFCEQDFHINPWSLNPGAAGVLIRNVTASGVSKHSGFTKLLEHRGVEAHEVLGVGDTLHDWDFIEHCGYKGVMSNATDELKEKYNLEAPNQHMGGHVDDDGLIDIFSYFKLL